MFLKLDHQKLEVYKTSRRFVLLCYRMTRSFPFEEKYALAQQIRRAGLSVHLNIAEGFSRRSLIERKRFFEISRGSIVEIDAALDIAYDLQYINENQPHELGLCMLECFRMLSSMIHKSSDPAQSR